jgi:hypothetical protein
MLELWLCLNKPREREETASALALPQQAEREREETASALPLPQQAERERERRLLQLCLCLNKPSSAGLQRRLLHLS